MAALGGLRIGSYRLRLVISAAGPGKAEWLSKRCPVSKAVALVCLDTIETLLVGYKKRQKKLEKAKRKEKEREKERRKEEKKEEAKYGLCLLHRFSSFTCGPRSK